MQRDSQLRFVLINKDQKSILKSAQKWVTYKFVPLQTTMSKLYNLTLEVLDAQHQLQLQCCNSSSKWINIHWSLNICITRHILSIRHFSDSTITSYSTHTKYPSLNIYYLTTYARRVLLVWNELSKWLKYIVTHMSKPIWD